jgi:hypothetical protein
MTIRVWHLGLPLLLLLVGGAFYVTHGTSEPVAAPATVAQAAVTTTTPAPAEPATARGASSSASTATGQYAADATHATDTIRVLRVDIDSYAGDNVPGGRSDPDGSHSDSGYAGMTIAILHSVYDQSIPVDTWVNPSDPGYPAGIASVATTKNTYCAVSKSGSVYAWEIAPSGITGWSTSLESVCRT